MSRWWEQDMSDASQGMFSDPATAIQIATMPIQLIAQNQQNQAAAEQQARDARGGFLKQTMSLMGSAGHALDGALSHVPGWGVTKDLGKGAWYPVDKLASGAYWLYSNGVSQPLSTTLLMAATSQGGGIGSTSYFSAHDWANAWHKANNISPGQVVSNYENTMAAKDDAGIFGPIFGTAGGDLSKAEKQRVSQQADRFIYDTNYWRSKAGWKYTAGTGALDFMTSMGLDPTVAGLKVISAGAKGARSIRVATEAADAASKPSGFFSKSKATDALAKAITDSLSKTPEQITNSKKIQNFFDWIDQNAHSPWDIEQHPIWGSGRRKNPAAAQLSQILYNADAVDRPMILRFAMGDNTAASQLAVKNGGLLAQIGRMSDNRKLVDSVKFDPALFDHFMQEERAGRTSPSSVFGPGIGGTSPATLGNRLIEAPYPRPTTPGPRQSGWDALYGGLQKKADVYRSAVGDILTSGNGVRPMGGAAATTYADMLRFENWKAGRLSTLDTQISTMLAKGDEYSKLLGGIVKGIDEFSPGEANLFGTMKSMYRMGPLSFRNTENAADAAIRAQSVDRYGRKADGGFVARTIRQGYYNVPLRVVQAFGDGLPTTLVNHNDADAPDQVLNMLKRVPGLGQDMRASMVAAYSSAPDKVTRSQVLHKIQSDVVQHMAQRYDLSYDAARAIDGVIKTGTLDAYNKLTGKTAPKSQMFSSAENTMTGHRADMHQDGEAWIISPLAKTQLAYSEPLLDVKELDRFLSRNSGYLKSLKISGGRMIDGVRDVSDGLSNMWKAATLLRPGYIVRAPSEEMAAAAVKFGLMGSIMASAHGGKNWALNRGQQLYALAGKGSYASAIGGKTRLRIVDPTMENVSKELIGKSTRINVSDAWPVVMDRIDQEREAMAAAQKRATKMASDPAHDPADLAALRDEIKDHEDTIAEFTDYSHELLRNATDSKGRRYGEATFEHRGKVVPEAFSKEWENPIPRDEISSDAAMHVLFARSEAIDTARLIRTGHWTAVTRDEPNYMPSMLDALNKQWGQDDLFKKVAGDMSMKTASDWLKTPEGKIHLSYLGPKARDVESLLYGVRDTLEHYTAGNAVLLSKISRGENITEAEVRGAIEHGDLPPVHGEEVRGLTKRGNIETAFGAVDRIIEKGFRRLGTIPTDIMSRHPVYARAHEARMRQLIDQELSYQKSIGKGDSLTSKQLNAMHKKADQMARKDISQIVYDPARTTATQALRFIAPFLSAQIDGLERWGGLVAEKPQFLGTAAKIYNAPVAANLVTDSQGNPVDENGYVTERDDSGKVIGKKFVGIQDRMLHIKMPPGTRGLAAALTGTGGNDIPIKIQALNTILPGDPWWNPGTGPVVSLAASKLAEKDPAMGDFLQWAKVLPYGPQGFMDSVTPAYMRNVWNAFHPDSTKFQEAMLAEYQRQVADHANGGPPPDMRKAEKNAKKFMYLKALTSWMSPAQTTTTPLTGTPYQFYVDQYKKMQQVDPKNADANFLQKYGEDYFIFTASLNKSMGIAPTISALNTAKKYKDLIAGDSSLAPFIIGDVYNKGAFSSSAYYDEKHMRIGGEPVRTTQSVQDAVADNQRRLGWAAYNKVMNNLDANLIRAGFHSYTERGAEQFLAAKRTIQSGLEQLYPAWEEDFNTTDKGAVPRRIKSFEILVQDPRLADDPMRQDIPALKQYLAAREIFKAQLAARGAEQLTYDPEGNPVGQNADIGQAWRNMQMALVASNTKFGDVFHRYLSNDDLQ